MDLSALIFVALAVAWAVYLIPKALRHHEEDSVSRSVESFSDRMRVLARRDAVSAERAELVVGDQRREPVERVGPAEPVAVEPEPAVPVVPTPAQRRQRRAAAARAARRRRRVLGLVLLANVVVIALAVASVVPWGYVAIPAGLLVAWLAACRLMVRRERVARVAAAVPVRKRRRTLSDEALAAEDATEAEELADGTSEFEVVAAEAAEDDAVPGGWDPVPMTLPTYVAKASAGRTVRTIDLDSTGVWSSGRNAADSQLAREAEADARSAETEGERKRASGA